MILECQQRSIVLIIQVKYTLRDIKCEFFFQVYGLLTIQRMYQKWSDVGKRRREKQKVGVKKASAVFQGLETCEEYRRRTHFL